MHACGQRDGGTPGRHTRQGYWRNRKRASLARTRYWDRNPDTPFVFFAARVCVCVLFFSVDGIGWRLGGCTGSGAKAGPVEQLLWRSWQRVGLIIPRSRVRSSPGAFLLPENLFPWERFSASGSVSVLVGSNVRRPVSTYAWMPERSKGADLRSAGRKSAWVRTPLQAQMFLPKPAVFFLVWSSPKSPPGRKNSARQQRDSNSRGLRPIDF